MFARRAVANEGERERAEKSFSRACTRDLRRDWKVYLCAVVEWLVARDVYTMCFFRRRRPVVHEAGRAEDHRVECYALLCTIQFRDV